MIAGGTTVYSKKEFTATPDGLKGMRWCFSGHSFAVFRSIVNLYSVGS